MCTVTYLIFHKTFAYEQIVYHRPSALIQTRWFKICTFEGLRSLLSSTKFLSNPPLILFFLKLPSFDSFSIIHLLNDAEFWVTFQTYIYSLLLNVVWCIVCTYEHTQKCVYMCLSVCVYICVQSLTCKGIVYYALVLGWLKAIFDWQKMYFEVCSFFRICSKTLHFDIGKWLIAHSKLVTT